MGTPHPWRAAHAVNGCCPCVARARPPHVPLDRWPCHGSLSFSSGPGTLSRRMNHLVRRMGTGILKEAEGGAHPRERAPGGQTGGDQPCIHQPGVRLLRLNQPRQPQGESIRVCLLWQTGAPGRSGGPQLVEPFREVRTCEYVKHIAPGMQGLERWAARMRPPGNGNSRCLAAPGRRWRRPGGPA
jgi:hypothetical protein